MKVIWTQLSLDTYLKVIDNLKKQWGEEIVDQFILLTEETIIHLKDELITHKSSQIIDGIHQAVIHKNISLYYFEPKDTNQIVLLTFFGNKMDPNSLKKLLKNSLS